MIDAADAPPIPFQLLVLDPRQTGWAASLTSAASDTAVLLLDPRRDGLRQLVEVAGAYAPLQAIHLPDHGEAGHVILGTSVLNAASLGAAAETLASLAGYMAPGGTVQLAGRPGQGPAGRNLASLLSRILGRRVQAARPMPVPVTGARVSSWPVWNQSVMGVRSVAVGGA